MQKSEIVGIRIKSKQTSRSSNSETKYWQHEPVIAVDVIICTGINEKVQEPECTIELRTVII